MASLRAEMPLTAAWIDEMREAFGTEMINDQIKLGMQGAKTFYAEENGHRVGTPFDVTDPAKLISGDRLTFCPTLHFVKGVRRGGS